MEVQYHQFREELIKWDKLEEILSKIGLYNINAKYASNNLYYYFTSFEMLILDFFDVSNIINNMKKQSTETKIFLTGFYLNGNAILNEAIDIIKYKVEDEWINLHNKINKIITRILNKIFNNLFKDLKSYNETDSGSINNIEPYSIYLNDEKNEKFLTIDFSINSFGFGYNFNIDTNNNNFLVTMNTYVKLDSILRTSVADVYDSLTEGNFGSAKVGYTNVFLLNNKTVNSEAFINYGNNSTLSYKKKINYLGQNKIVERSNERKYEEIKINKIFKIKSKKEIENEFNN